MINKKANYKVLSISFGHESNACLLINGKIESYAAEERFNKKKCFVGYPTKAINFCLKHAKIKSNELDHVIVVSKKTNIDQIIVKRNSTFSVKDFIKEQEKYWYPKIFLNSHVKYLDLFKDKIIPNEDFDFRDYLKEIKKKPNINSINYFKEIRIKKIMKHLKIKKKNIIHIDHEKGHQYYALFASPEKFRKKSLILTNEGMGDRSNLTVSKVLNNNLKEIFASKENRVGTLYKYITLLLGMKLSQHEYKVMGLAPYASNYEIDKAYNAAFKNLFIAKKYGIFSKNKPKDFYFTFKEKLKHCRFDGIAGALQKAVEEILIKWIKNCIKLTKINSIVISGGVAQNIKAAIPISEIKELKNFYINPSSGDSTLSVGGCYYAAHIYGKSKIEKLNNIYLGPAFSNHEIKKSIEKFLNKNPNFSLSKIKNNKKIVDLLISGKILGRFDGRMELGQRALGNRSIIADPRKPQTIKVINQKIKKRDFWMPFTPTILDKYKKKYLINQKNLDCPFMTMAFKTTNYFQNIAPATLHPSDLTTRPQILERTHNPKYYDLIKDFGLKTGAYCLLNTSLNIHGFPMACNADDALFTLKNSELDGLIMENYLLLR